MLSWTVVLLALFASVQGRAVNISNTWVLPEEGFPVFYRYFRDRISWYEADAVCQFHHANLVTVDTTAQYDAVRAYLKELDISSAVWVGLIRSNPDGEFTWTDYRGLSGDGYWSSAPDARAAPLCAAADPAADYRWEARTCGGPTVASFICELSVPQWALGNQGCMVRALPALTVLYLPESAAVQLTADCGLAGTKRVQCTGNVKREDLLKNLSCAEDDDSSSTPNAITVGTTWSATTDTVYTDQETTSEVSTEENITTEHEEEIAQVNTIKTTSNSHNLPQGEPVIKQETKINELNNIFSLKNINLDVVNNNNLQSNLIPKLGTNENFLTVEQTDKLEDEQHMQIKILHDELSRHGNFEKIFTQPTDHFVPPLVMAKAKISNDMTVLSLAEKHAQQLAEQRFAKHNTQNGHNEHLLHESNVKHKDKSSTEETKNVDSIDKPLVMTLLPIKVKDNGKKDNVKYGVPKKYLEKYDDPKGRNLKIIDNKLSKIAKSTEIPITSTESTSKIMKTTTMLVAESENISEEDSSIDLTVMLKELGMENSRTPLYSNHSNKTPQDEVKPNNISLDKSDMNKATKEGTSKSESVTESQTTSTMKNIVTNHEVIKITIINDEHSSKQTPIVFEITTKTPDFENVHISNSLPITTQKSTENVKTDDGITTNPIKSTSPSVSSGITSQSDVVTASPHDFTTTSLNLDLKHENLLHLDTKIHTTEETPTTVTEVLTLHTTPKQKNLTVDLNKSITESATTTANIVITTTTENTDVSTNHVDTVTEGYMKDSTDTIEEFQRNTEAVITTTDNEYPTTRELIDIFNYTGSHEEDYAKNWTDSSEAIDDFQSPLLSAANEPLHRPNRSRRPQQPNRISKFNPFRILG